MREQAEKNPGRFFAYVRVSDDKQVDSGLGLEAQVNDLKAYYERTLEHRGVTWDGSVWFDLAVSAFKLNFLDRPGIVALNEVVRPGDHVAAVRMDRFVRSLAGYVSMGCWLDQSVYIHMLDMGVDTSTLIGASLFKMSGAMSAVMAQWESQVKSERLKAVNRVRRQQGRATNGKKAWGWKTVVPGGPRVRDTDEINCMWYMDRLSKSGMSAHAIAKAVKKRLPNRHPMNAYKVHRALAALREAG